MEERILSYLFIIIYLLYIIVDTRTTFSHIHAREYDCEKRSYNIVDKTSLFIINHNLLDSIIKTRKHGMGNVNTQINQLIESILN